MRQIKYEIESLKNNNENDVVKPNVKRNDNQDVSILKFN